MEDIGRKGLFLLYGKTGSIVIALLLVTLIVTMYPSRILFYALAIVAATYFIGILAYMKHRDKVFMKVMRPLTTGKEDFLHGGWARVIRKGSEIIYKVDYESPKVKVKASYPLPIGDEADTFNKITSLMEKWTNSHDGDIKHCECEMNDNHLCFTISLTLPLSSFKRLATDIHKRLISIISTFNLDAERTTRRIKGTWRSGKSFSCYCIEFKGYFYSRGIYKGKAMLPCDEEVIEIENLTGVMQEDHPEQITEEEFKKLYVASL